MKQAILNTEIQNEASYMEFQEDHSDDYALYEDDFEEIEQIIADLVH